MTITMDPVSPTTLLYFGGGAIFLSLLLMATTSVVTHQHDRAPVGAYIALGLLFIAGVFGVITAVAGVGAAGTTAGIMFVALMFAGFWL